MGSLAQNFYNRKNRNRLRFRFFCFVLWTAISNTKVHKELLFSFIHLLNLAKQFIFESFVLEFKFLQSNFKNIAALISAEISF